MPTENIRAFKQTWTYACKTMWMEVTALRHLQGRLLGDYAAVPKERLLTDLTYAPEAKGRIDDGTKDFFLERVEQYVDEVALLRVVLLSAAFEVFFDNFVDGYLKKRGRSTLPGGRGR